MAGSSDISLLGARALRDRIASRELSPVELMGEVLGRIERHNGDLNALVTLSGTAMDQARDLEAALARGDDPGPLCGIPVGIKDVTPVRGLRHTAGSTRWADRVADTDAVVVQRLRDAGAIVLGKTNTPELGVGAHTFNEVFGVTRNPWNRELSAGGSTGGGAAALAAGLIGLAEGTDLGGSLRIPAAFCGVVGLRPTPGLIPTWPGPYPWDTLQVTGLMARRAEDLALALEAVAGPSPRAPVGQPLDYRDLAAQLEIGLPAGARVGYCPDVAGIGIDPRIESVCRQLVDRLADEGSQVEEVRFDVSWAREAFMTLRGYWMVCRHADLLEAEEPPGDQLRAAIEAGMVLAPADFARAEADRGRLWDAFQRYFAHFDFLLTPSTAVQPFPADERFPTEVGGRAMETYIDWVAPTFVLSLAGLPVASVPAGLDEEGLPVGIQVVGPQAGEGRVLGAAAAIQAVAPVGAPPLE